MPFSPLIMLKLSIHSDLISGLKLEIAVIIFLSMKHLFMEQSLPFLIALSPHALINYLSSSSQVLSRCQILKQKGLVISKDIQKGQVLQLAVFDSQRFILSESMLHENWGALCKLSAPRPDFLFITDPWECYLLGAFLAFSQSKVFCEPSEGQWLPNAPGITYHLL